MFLLIIRETYLILLNVKGVICFATAFHCSLLIPHPVFCSVLSRQSFLPHCRHDSSHCLQLKVSFPVSIPSKVFSIRHLRDSVVGYSLNISLQIS